MLLFRLVDFIIFTWNCPAVPAPITPGFLRATTYTLIYRSHHRLLLLYYIITAIATLPAIHKTPARFVHTAHSRFQYPYISRPVVDVGGCLLVRIPLLICSNKFPVFETETLYTYERSVMHMQPHNQR